MENAVNSIIEKVAYHLEQNDHILKVSPDDRVRPTGIVLTLGDGTEVKYDLEYKGDLQRFMKDWKSASNWLQIKWESLQ